VTDGLDANQLEKLTIETYTGKEFTKSQRVGEWKVLFNPTEYTFTRSNNYNATQAAGTSRPNTSPGSGNPDQLACTLFFDGTGVVGDPGPITSAIAGFLDLMSFKREKHKPYYLWLRWGPLTFRCYLKSATVSFTLFNREGEPIRAKVTASFEEVIADRERVNQEAFTSPDLRRLWRVEEGQSLDTIAFETYDDPRYWREIARANRLANPRALEVGRLLVLPPKAA
jgi:Contractile injection system tube protein